MKFQNIHQSTKTGQYEIHQDWQSIETWIGHHCQSKRGMPHTIEEINKVKLMLTREN